MRRTGSVRFGAGLAAALCAAGLLSGCSAAAPKGGDTTCGEFNKMNKEDQTGVIRQMISEDGNSEPANIEVNGKLVSAQLYCKTLASDSNTVREAPLS